MQISLQHLFDLFILSVFCTVVIYLRRLLSSDVSRLVLVYRVLCATDNVSCTFSLLTCLPPGLLAPHSP